MKVSPYTGFFKPLNPQKYIGNPLEIVYRSKLELKFMYYLDRHPDIIEWQSEEFSIPYLSSIDGRMHRYFPDFKIKKCNKNGIIETLIIEIKPSNMLEKPKLSKTKKITKKYIAESKAWIINNNKFEAAKEYCSRLNMKFLIITEKELGITYGSTV